MPKLILELCAGAGGQAIGLEMAGFKPRPGPNGTLGDPIAVVAAAHDPETIQAMEDAVVDGEPFRLEGLPTVQDYEMDFGRVEILTQLDVQKVGPVPSSNVPRRRASGERLQKIRGSKRRRPAKAELLPAKKPGAPKVPVRASEFNDDLPWPEDEDEKVKPD